MPDDRRFDICFLSSAHPALDKRVFAKEAVSLASAGYAVAHICPAHPGDAGLHGGVEIIPYRAPEGSRARRLTSLIRLYRVATAQPASAYHCNEPDSWLVGAVLKLTGKGRLICDVHEHYPSSVDRWVPSAVAPLARRLMQFALQALGLVSDRVVLAKRSIEADYSWSRARHLVVINSALVRPVSQRPNSPSTNSVVRFVHSGVFSVIRGALVLVEALGELRRRGAAPAEVIIVGGFNDGSRDAVLARADALGVRQQIIELGWLSLEESLAAVEDSDVGLLLLSKLHENNVRAMPHKLFDYMQAGIPIVAPDFCPEVVSILEDARCSLLIDTDDYRAVADAMQRMIEDPLLRRKLGHAGRMAVERTYNWEQESRLLIGAYEALIGPPKRHAAT